MNALSFASAAIQNQVGRKTALPIFVVVNPYLYSIRRRIYL